jgi:DNA-binding transcriptional regulator YiaG
MKRRKETLKGFGGLDYLTITGVPIRETAHGEVIDIPYERLERLVAKAIVKNAVPIRGLEVKFLRKALGLSLGAFAKELELTAPGVLKWEKAAKERLLMPNEAAVRAFAAEKLGIRIDGRLSQLVPSRDRAEKLELEAS